MKKLVTFSVPTQIVRLPKLAKLLASADTFAVFLHYCEY